MGLLLIIDVNKAFYFEKIFCSSCPSKSGHFLRITHLVFCINMTVTPKQLTRTLTLYRLSKGDG